MTKDMKIFLLCLLLLICTSCDLSTKYLAKQHLQHTTSIKVIPDIVDLRYTENYAIAFSMLHSIDRPWRTIIIYSSSILAFIILGFITYQSRGESFLWQGALMLILAGAIGNLIDRVANGYVVDFIHLHYGDKFNWPIFNVADITITCGAIILAILMLQKSSREKKKMLEYEKI